MDTTVLTFVVEKKLKDHSDLLQQETISQTAGFKVPLESECVLLIIISLGCLSFAVQNNECEEFDTRRLLSHSSNC